MLVEKNTDYLPYDDYAQSANTLFHFMTKQDYLTSALCRRALIPRYCIENIDYLGIHNSQELFKEIAVLQKCFCDIPFHKLADKFSVNGTGENFKLLSEEERMEIEQNNTHCSFYGEYAIAFSKSWGEKRNLQPVHYLNRDSQYAKEFTALFELLLTDEELPDAYSQDVINRLAYIKPLRGIMQRNFNRNGSSSIFVEIYKNFHDEREWRYVPNAEVLSSLATESIIANPGIIRLSNEFSKGFENERYKSLWLKFSYDDIRYIIVPDLYARIDTIKTIMELSDSHFENQDNIPMQKSILISKILVLSEIRRDW